MGNHNHNHRHHHNHRVQQQVPPRMLYRHRQWHNNNKTKTNQHHPNLRMPKIKKMIRKLESEILHTMVYLYNVNDTRNSFCCQEEHENTVKKYNNTPNKKFEFPNKTTTETTHATDDKQQIFFCREQKFN